MATITAQILIGKSHPWHGGIIPSHALYLYENSRPAWVLIPSGLDPNPEEPGTPRVRWIPTVEHMLEDGLLMIWLMVAKVPQICEMATRSFAKPLTHPLAVCEDINLEQLRDLREACKAIPINLHFGITIFCESTILQQTNVLREYPVSMEICPWNYARIKTPDGPRELKNDHWRFDAE